MCPEGNLEHHLGRLSNSLTGSSLHTSKIIAGNILGQSLLGPACHRPGDRPQRPDTLNTIRWLFSEKRSVESRLHMAAHSMVPVPFGSAAANAAFTARSEASAP